VTGYTRSSDFPVQNAYQAAIAGTEDAFVTQINAAGSALVYSTFLGGDYAEWGRGIAVDGTGNAYVTGYTTSTNFPTANPFQAAHGADYGGSDAFVTKFDVDGSALVYSTYLGGSNRHDYGYGIAVAGNGSASVVGYTASNDFPTAEPIQGTLAGSSDPFVTRFDADGSTLVYSTYLGGLYTDYGYGIAVDELGNALVAGQTYSSDFPAANPFQASFGGVSDGFVAKIGEGVLDIFKVDSPDPVLAGAVLAYVTNVQNSGTVDAVDLSISDPLPANATFQSASPSADGDCVTPAVGENGTVTCTWLGVTAPGSVRTVSIAVQVDLGTPDGTILSNTATGSASGLDTVAATATTMVISTDDYLFGDGFESGDTSAWSAVAP